MPISQTCIANSLSAFNFNVLQKGMKYLGIILNLNVDEIMNDNVGKLLTRIKTNLEKWGKLHLALWGKVNTIKMAGAPLISYFIGMIPICISPQIFLRYDNMIKHFLWDGGRSRINLGRLYQPRKEGGLSLPNIKQYSISSL